ncbi:MAG: hypothetical protein LBR61_03425 [Synergistaceae bacterium]|jgi:hypothetical protein|nr:hypothetical protein [Synergistaceae bacterium]
MADDSEKLQKILEGGEIVRWSGSSQPYGLFDEAHKSFTMLSLMWALVWGIILVGGYFALCISRGLELKAVVMVVCAAVPLLIAWSPVGDKGNIKKLHYMVTDRKVVVSSSEGERACSMPIIDIDAIRAEKAGSDTCHLRFGSSTFKASAKKLPALAIRGEFDTRDNNKVYTGLVFYNISVSDGNTICDLLKPAVSIEGSTS